MKRYLKLIVLIFLLCLVLVGCKEDDTPKTEQVTITFDMNGGDAFDAVKIDKGAQVAFPGIAKKDGYTFVTWVLNDYEFDLTSTIDTDITLKAIWVKEIDEDTEAIVYFNTDGGTYIEPVVVKLGEKITEPTSPIKTGYNFKYWVDEFDNSRFNFNSAIEEELYLSAYYEERKKITVKFDTDGGEEIDNTFVYYGDKVGELPKANKEGYLFIGWYYNGNKVDNDFIPSIAVTLKAKYAEIGDGYKYVTFESDDGTVIEKQKVKMGEAALAPTAIKTGYTFKEWDKDFSFIYEDITVKAVFDINYYKVTIRDNVFWQVDETIDVPYMGSITAPILVDKSDKIFAGWDKELTNITGDTLILAVWKDASTITDEGKIEHTINLLNKNYNDGDYTNIVFATGESDLGTSVIWETSDGTGISLDGSVNLKYTKQLITLTAKVSSGSVNKTVTYEYNLPRKNMDLSQGVCAAYLYSEFSGDKNVLLDTFDVYYLAFANFNATGDVTSLGETGADFVKNNLDYIHERGAYAVISFRTTEIFASIAKNTSYCDHFAEEIVRVINKYDLDGVDIDWEYPSDKNEIDGYVYMMQVIYEKVKANNPSHLVTSAILLGAIDRFTLNKTIKTMDYVNLMTYELHSHVRTTHHTALYPSSKNGTLYAISSSVAQLRGYGVPYNKMIIGAGFFGRQYTKSSGLGTTAEYLETALRYGTIKSNYVDKQTETCKRYWDDECKVPYIYDSETGLFISYDDPESIYWKANYVCTYKLAGLMCWQTGQDNGDLINAFKDNYNLLKKIK